MFLKLKSYWNYGNTFCGIELTTINGEEIIFGITSKKKHGEFKDFEFVRFSLLINFSKNISKQQHCYLAINSDKVLIKYVTSESNDLKTISNAFPGLSLEDFYYEISRTAYGSIVAICRKDYVEKILSELKQQKVNVLGFNLGVAPLSVLIPLIEEQELNTPRYNIFIDEKDIKQISPNEFDIAGKHLIGSINILSEYLLSLSMLSNYTGMGFNSSNNFTGENKILLKSHQENIFFKKGLFLGVGVLLISLLINTFFFSSYFKKEQLLNEKLLNIELYQKDIKGKLESLNKKEELVDNILNNGSSKSSYYINAITALKPSSIGFLDLQFQPMKKSIKQDNKIEYSQNNIIISGQSLDKTDFSQWITEIGTLIWVENVSVIHYGSLGKEVTTFSVLIYIQNDPEK